MKKFTFLGGVLLSAMSFGQMTTQGSAVPYGTGCNCYQLTPAGVAGQSGAIWSPNSIDLTNSFDMSFQVYFGPGDAYGADGMTFVLQENSSGIGNGGWELGYGSSTSISAQSIAIEMDVFKSTSPVPSDPADDHIGISSNGSVQHNLAGPTIFPGALDIESSTYYDFRVVWDSGLQVLAVYWEGGGFPLIAYNGDIVNTIFGGNSTVYWGFTAGTGGFTNDMRVCTNSAASFSVDNATVCPGTPIAFTDNSTSDLNIINGWSWDFGDGSPADNNQNPSYAYSGSGSFTAELTMTDGFGCDYTSTTNITILPDITMDMDSTAVTCFGDTDGTGTATPTNGTGPYVYSWNDLSTQSTQTASGLAPGVYTVTITDDLGCTGMDSVMIDEPAEILLAMGAIDNICYGDSSGTAYVDVTNGVPGFTYSWDDYLGQTLDSAYNLPIGMYTVVVTDADGCSKTDSVEVFEGAELVLNGTSTDDNGTNNGTIDLTVMGGAAPYTYSWDNGETTEDLSGLASGIYQVTVTDANGCQNTINVEVKSSANITEATDFNISVYPNPSEGEFNIKADQEFDYVIYDMSGKAITADNSSGKSTVDIKFVERGMYILLISIDGKSVQQKLIID